MLANEALSDMLGHHKCTMAVHLGWCNTAQVFEGALIDGGYQHHDICPLLRNAGLLHGFISEYRMFTVTLTIMIIIKSN